MSYDHVIFELSKSGVRCIPIPDCDVPIRDQAELLGKANVRAEKAFLPEVSEGTLTRHITNLSQKNVGVDTHFYPLGSCTMKYNPRVNERVAGFEGFTGLHPYQDESQVQGFLELMARFEKDLAEIAGMPAVSLQPAAGAHGELTGMKVISAALADKGSKRTTVLIPDSAHGTNPASAILCGFKCQQVNSNDRGCIDLEDFKSKLDENTAALMVTSPNTLGLFEEDIVEIADLLHEAGAYLYMDGANLNALLGLTRPGDFGVDVLHFNLHKTFSTPHGMGGPGSGPISVSSELEKYLPVPRIVENDGTFSFDYEHPDSIGRVKAFYGNTLVIVKAYAYIRELGSEGLNRVRDAAVLNANYLQARLKDAFQLDYDRYCMHEFVLAGTRQKKKGVRTLDMAKRLLDLGFHPPTVYFPLIVDEALMIEPTETESKETLDAFADALLRIAREVDETPELVTNAPLNMPVGRLDEVTAAKKPILKWEEEQNE